MKRSSEIQIRDPFIVPLESENRYYLFGTTDDDPWDPPAVGFEAYRSRDLEVWEGPFRVFTPPADFWADRNFWAPEVHRIGERWVMFASFKSADRRRGTQILSAPEILGPYEPVSAAPATPEEWECLDGTYWNDGERSWMIFCHEWVQTGNGSIRAMPLREDLSGPAGPPLLLFRAADAPWAEALPILGSAGNQNFVTDGPYLLRHGEVLLMIWSSFVRGRYAIGMAASASGTVEGPWEHAPLPLYDEDGGHGMIFRDFAGQFRLAIHTPNDTPRERPIFPYLDMRHDWPVLRRASVKEYA